MSLQKLNNLLKRMVGKSQTKQIPKVLEVENFSTGPDHIDLIGNGSFAKVRRCYHEQLNTVVIKYFALTGSQETIDQKLEDAAKEAITLMNIDHRNIVRVLGVTSWNNNCGIIMEEVNGGSLEDLLFKKSSDPIPWQLRLRFFIEIADALKYLHNQKPPFVHGDLKPQNVLLMSDYTIKLADFGSVAIFQASQMASSFQIPSNKQYTPLYCAPELLKDINNRRPSSDIYSYAMVGYEIICRRRVFVAPGVSQNLIMYHIMHNGQKPNIEFVDEVEKSLKGNKAYMKIFLSLRNTVIKCWSFDANDRPTASSLLDELKILGNLTSSECDISGKNFTQNTQREFRNFERKSLSDCTSLYLDVLPTPSYITEYLSMHLVVTVKILGSYQYNKHTLQITLKNNGYYYISPGHSSNWSIYFNHYNALKQKTSSSDYQDVFPPSSFDLDLVNNNLYKLTPNLQFKGLKSNEETDLHFDCSFLASHHLIFPRWYVCVSGKQPVIIKCTDDESLDFVTNFDRPEQYLRSFDDPVVPFSPLKRYNEYKLADFGCAPLRIVPKTFFSDFDQNMLKLSGNNCFCSSSTPLFGNEAVLLKRYFGIGSTKNTEEPKTTINFKRNSATKENQCDEAYQIEINSISNCIDITAQSRAGAFYAVQSLTALAETLSQTNTTNLPSGLIKDKPRFSYRGLQIDVVKNFVNVSDLLLIIKVMAMYKLNKLVLQLSHNEGWRIEIRGLPELTEVGANRRHTENGDAIPPAFGSGPHENTSGSGYYTIDDYKKILQVASDHCIEVIPKIYMPGQCKAAILAMQKRYTSLKNSNLSKAKEFLLHNIKDDSSTNEFLKHPVLNPSIESVYTFIDHVVKEIKSMHHDIQPLQTFYIGGFGLQNKKWADSQLYESFKNASSIPAQISNFHQYFMNRATDICWKKHAVKLGIHAKAALQLPSDDPWPQSIVDKNGVLIYASKTNYKIQTFERGYKLANAGYKVVLSHASYFFLDHAQEPDPEEKGQSWATRYIDDKMVFSFKPDNVYNNPNTDQFLKILAEEDPNKKMTNHVQLRKPENVVGMQAYLYTKLIRDVKTIHFHLFPRLLAFAERAWHKAEWEADTSSQALQHQKRDWESFANRVGYKELERLSSIGINYRVPPPGVSVRNSKVELCAAYPGFRFLYRKHKEKNIGEWNECKSSGLLIEKKKTYDFVTVEKEGNRQSRIAKVKPSSLLVDELYSWMDAESLYDEESFAANGRMFLLNSSER